MKMGARLLDTGAGGVGAWQQCPSPGRFVLRVELRRARVATGVATVPHVPRGCRLREAMRLIVNGLRHDGAWCFPKRGT